MHEGGGIVAGIRRFRASDTDDLYAVCIGTGDSGEDATALYDDPRLLGEVYVGPYLVHSPEFAWVYANDADQARGYVLGVLDTRAFEAALDADWWPALQAKYPLDAAIANPRDREVVEALHTPGRASDALVAAYPSHLHIDMLPDVRGGGRGGAMLRTLLDALAAAGSPGVHLDVAASNENAIGFYRHFGFTPSETEPATDSLIMCRRF